MEEHTNKSNRESRLLEGVKTPLNFFVFIVLIAESILFAAFAYASGEERWLILGLMLGMLFLLVLLVAFLAFYRPEALRGLRSPDFSRSHGSVAYLGGEWDILIRTSDGLSLKGTASIRQHIHQSAFKIVGRVVKEGEYFISFSSLLGGVSDGSLYFIYENTDNERGVAWGMVPSEKPMNLSLVYRDLVGFGKSDPSGQIDLVRMRA